MTKVLIAYYSHRGENYVDGKVQSLSVGIGGSCAEKTH